MLLLISCYSMVFSFSFIIVLYGKKARFPIPVKTDLLALRQATVFLHPGDPIIQEMEVLPSR